MVNLFDLLSSPQLVHAAAVHFPIALGILGVPLIFLCAVTQMKNATLRWLAFACYILMAATAFGTILTGESAYHALPNTLTPNARALVDAHASLAENVWIFAIVTALFVMLAGVKSERWRTAFTVLAVLASVATGIYAAIAASNGAALVYKEGVGTPRTAVSPSQTPQAAEAASQQTQTPPPSPGAPAVSPPAAGASEQPPAPNAAPANPARPSYTSRVISFWKNIKRALWY